MGYARCSFLQLVLGCGFIGCLNTSLQVIWSTRGCVYNPGFVFFGWFFTDWDPMGFITIKPPFGGIFWNFFPSKFIANSSNVYSLWLWCIFPCFSVYIWFIWSLYDIKTYHHITSWQNLPRKPWLKCICVRCPECQFFWLTWLKLKCHGGQKISFLLIFFPGVIKLPILEGSNNANVRSFWGIPLE